MSTAPIEVPSSTYNASTSVKYPADKSIPPREVDAANSV